MGVYRPELMGDPAAGVAVLEDTLLLVGVEADRAELEAWSPLERCVAMNWAVRVHLSASDNLNRVPPRPSIVRASWGGDGADALRDRLPKPVQGASLYSHLEAAFTSFQSSVACSSPELLSVHLTRLESRLRDVAERFQ